MNQLCKGLIILCLLLAPLAALAEETTTDQGAVAKAHGYNVQRFVLTSDIIDREPVDQVTNFPLESEKAFIFIEFGQVEFNTQATVVWSYNGDEVALVPLMIGAGSRWRTYSSKNIAGLPGAWNVEMISESGEILTAIEFQVN